jgi:hypothetical protein
MASTKARGLPATTAGKYVGGNAQKSGEKTGATCIGAEGCLHEEKLICPKTGQDVAPGYSTGC